MHNSHTIRPYYIKTLFKRLFICYQQIIPQNYYHYQNKKLLLFSHICTLPFMFVDNTYYLLCLQNVKQQQMKTYEMFLFFGFLCSDNLMNKTNVFLSLLYMRHYYKMVAFFQNSFSLIPQSFSIFHCIFQKKSTSLISEDMVILSSNVLPLQIYSGSFIHSGLTL